MPEPILLDPIVKSIEVPCGQQQAFDVFVAEIGSWWPTGKFSVSAFSGQSARSLTIEPELGGRVVEIGFDGAEHHWGTIRSFDPHESFSMDFHIAEPASSASLVEVRFTVLGPARTRVVLTQSNWEAFGDKAEMMRGGYGSGWAAIFEQEYKAACGG